jgi:DNA-binding NarL/FixJ family response regulator
VTQAPLMNDPIRIVIADDHPVIRAGLRELLSSHGDLVVAGEAANGLQAVDIWHERMPDVGLFDLRMPGLNGLEAMQRIRERQPQAAIVILTTLTSEADMDRAVAASASAYLPKQSSLTEIVACIRAVRRGTPYVHSILRRRLIERGVEEALTPREGEVLSGIARGWRNRRVADDLGIAEGTVKTHLKRLFGKLCARNRTEAVAIARSKGLLGT